MRDVLNRFLDLYAFDPDATYTALVDMAAQIVAVGEGGAHLSKEQRLELIVDASAKSRLDIKRKTLIDVPIDEQSIRELVSDLTKQGYDKQCWTKHSEIVRGMIYRSLAEHGVSLSMQEEAGLQKELEELDEKKRLEQSASLRRADISTALSRWFASNVDSAADAIERFDSTPFHEVIPLELVVPFRELHVNAILGNYGTALILCGALLERALKDLLPSTSPLSDLILEAKADGLLSGHRNRFADRIRDDRNHVVHGRVSFDAIRSDHAWETIGFTRRLVADLYKGRLEEEQ